jgi:hypothetical protein
MPEPGIEAAPTPAIEPGDRHDHRGLAVVRRSHSTAGVGVNQGHFATYWQKWAKANKRWKPIGQRRVARGDVIVYGSFAQSGHVGVVIDVRINAKGRATAVRTVEGNVRDRVVDTGWRSINALTGRNLRASGFVSPV